MVTSWEPKKEKKPGRLPLPLILLGIFAIACLVALVFLGDLSRYQEAGLVEESQAALRDVNDPGQLEQALKRYPANRILKLVALADGESAALDAALRKLLDDARPAALAKPPDLTVASRGDLDTLRRDLKTAEASAAAVTSASAALIKARRDELERSARTLGVEHTTIARFMTAIDEQHADIAALAARMLAARTEYYVAYEKAAALLVREFGSYKVTNGQFIFRIQPTADSYNAASAAMAAATKRMAELDEEKGALRQSQLNRWKKFVGG